MALPTNWARGAVHAMVEGHDCVNVLWWTVTGTVPASPDANALAATIDTNINLQYKSIITTECFWRGVDVSLSVGGVVYSGQTSPNAAGVITGDTMPAEIAAVARKVTATPGKVGRGRWFFPGVPEGYFDSSFIAGAGPANYAAVIVQFLLVFTTQGMTFTPQHHSKKLNSLMPILSAPMDVITRHQKRRRPRR